MLEDAKIALSWFAWSSSSDARVDADMRSSTMTSSQKVTRPRSSSATPILATNSARDRERHAARWFAAAPIADRLGCRPIVAPAASTGSFVFVTVSTADCCSSDGAHAYSPLRSSGAIASKCPSSVASGT